MHATVLSTAVYSDLCPSPIKEPSKVEPTAKHGTGSLKNTTEVWAPSKTPMGWRDFWKRKPWIATKNGSFNQLLEDSKIMQTPAWVGITPGLYEHDDAVGCKWLHGLGPNWRQNWKGGQTKCGRPRHASLRAMAKIKLVWNLEPCLLQEKFVDV